jgi:hypothetical protein
MSKYVSLILLGAIVVGQDDVLWATVAVERIRVIKLMMPSILRTREVTTIERSCVDFAFRRGGRGGPVGLQRATGDFDLALSSAFEERPSAGPRATGRVPRRD